MYARDQHEIDSWATCYCCTGILLFHIGSAQSVCGCVIRFVKQVLCTTYPRTAFYLLVTTKSHENNVFLFFVLLHFVVSSCVIAPMLQTTRDFRDFSKIASKRKENGSAVQRITTSKYLDECLFMVILSEAVSTPTLNIFCHN